MRGRAACGLALFMAGAATTRFRRREWTYLLGDLVYLSLFAFLAWGRFRPPAVLTSRGCTTTAARRFASHIEGVIDRPSTRADGAWP